MLELGKTYKTGVGREEFWILQESSGHMTVFLDRASADSFKFQLPHWKRGRIIHVVEADE